MVYINEWIDVNTALKIPSNLWVVCVGSTIDPSVSKTFPMLASRRLYLDIFFQIYEDFYGNYDSEQMPSEQTALHQFECSRKLFFVL